MTMKYLLSSCAALLAASAAFAQTASVSATVETDPMPNSGDAADDPAIWVHRTDPGLSVVIGTDKQEGIAVYDMSGRELQFRSDGKLNNVDLRYGFPLGGKRIDIVTAGNRSNDSIEIYRLDPESRRLEDIAAGTIDVGLTMYGSCMYHSRSTGEFYAIVNSSSGEVEQWRLFDNGSGRVDAERVRSFDVGSQVEGCVADDELGWLYIGEESSGIWKYGAEPDSGTSRSRVDTTGSGGRLTADVEGLAIYYAPDGKGYLIASSQGANEYVIYERGGSNEYVGTFRVTTGGSIDGTSDTDGIDVSSANLGPDFPSGVFIAQDGSNTGGNQNFKLVPWQRIAESFSPSLIVDTRWDPRSDDAEPPPPPPAKPMPPTELTVQ